MNLTRLARATIIRDRVLEAGRADGRWERLDVGGGLQARVWVIDGDGWKAYITTRFSGVPRGAVASSYDEAVLLQSAPPRESDVVLDLHHPQAGKVLSIGTTDGVDELIGMQPGPWEAMFGLPERDWSPSVRRRLAARA